MLNFVKDTFFFCYKGYMISEVTEEVSNLIRSLKDSERSILISEIDAQFKGEING